MSGPELGQGSSMAERPLPLRAGLRSESVPLISLSSSQWPLSQETLTGYLTTTGSDSALMADGYAVRTLESVEPEWTDTLCSRLSADRYRQCPWEPHLWSGKSPASGGGVRGIHPGILRGANKG